MTSSDFKIGTLLKAPKGWMIDDQTLTVPGYAGRIWKINDENGWEAANIEGLLYVVVARPRTMRNAVLVREFHSNIGGTKNTLGEAALSQYQHIIFVTGRKAISGGAEAIIGFVDVKRLPIHKPAQQTPA